MASQQELFAGGLAVITGGAGGLGAGLARHAALRLGMTVLLVDIDPKALEATREDIERSGGKAATAVVDVRRPEEIETLAARVAGEFGPVRLLINNAGIEQFSLLWDTPAANWNRLVDININGVFYGIHAFLPGLLKQEEPVWVWNTASVGGVTAAPYQGAYIMSKHAVIAMTECLHQEVALVGAGHIHVGAILPWAVASRIFETAGGAESGIEAAANVRDASEQGRNAILTPEQAAETIFEQGANGEFYIVTDDAVLEMMKDRAETLAYRKAPRRFEEQQPTVAAQ